MADIAQIGFAADTSQLEKAKTSLQQLVPPAQAAETAAIDLSGALDKASKSTTAVSQAAQGLQRAVSTGAKAVQAAAGVSNQASNAANDNAKANDHLANSHKGLSTQAMAAQHSIRSMVEQLAMGAPISNVLTAQLNHLTFAASGPGGLSQAFKDALGAFKGLMSGWLLAGGAVAAVAGVFLLLANSVIKSTLALDDLSKATDRPIAELHALQQAMSFKGISQDDFTSGMKSFADSVYQAQHNVGDLNGLMIANNVQAKSFNQYLYATADLVKQASSGIQKQKILREAGLPSDAAWVRFMEQGGKGIQAAISASEQFNTAAEKNLVQKARDFDDAWNTATTKMVQYFKSAIVDIVAAMSGVKIPEWMKAFASGAASGAAKGMLSNGPVGAIGGAIVGGIQNTISPQDKPAVPRLYVGPNRDGVAQAASGKQPKTKEELQEENRQAQARISILGDMATVEQQVTLKQLELNAAGLQGLDVTKQQNDAIINATRATAEMARVQQQSAIGIYNERDARKAAADTLQMWIDKGLIDKTNVEQMAAAQQTLKRSLVQTKEAAQLAAAPLQQLKQLELDASNFGKMLDGTLTQSLQGLVSPIQDVLNGVTSIGQGFKNMGVVVLKAIQEMIIKMLILAPIAKGLQAIFGGFFGGGGIFGATTKSANGNIFANDNISPFANGGMFTNSVVTKPTLFTYASGGRMGLMGEAGPEAIMPLQRGPNGSLGVQMYGGKGSNDNAPIAVTYAPQYNVAQGADPQAIAELRTAQANDRRAFVGNVGKAVTELRKRNARV